MKRSAKAKKTQGRPTKKRKARHNPEEEEGSPKGAKRARANEDGDAVQNDDEEENEDTAGTELPKRDADGFLPGSIVRIQLRNFVTYDSVELRPGASLNMILGPNGTGKSSIAYAICLGLNWPPKIIGRAMDLNHFVKLGTENGHIEIELKAAASEDNLVIRRNLIAANRGSTFTLNGESVSGGEITEIVTGLNIQCGNLCSFMPQDRVAEFAALTPAALLRETQRAAGDERLTAWHDTLIGLGRELKTLVETIRNDESTLRQLTERNEGLERDVKRFLDRKRIQNHIALLRIQIAMQRYREARAYCIGYRARLKELYTEASRLREKNKLARLTLEDTNRRCDARHEEYEAAKKNVCNIRRTIGECMQSAESLECVYDDLKNELLDLERTEKTRLAQIKKCETDIENLTAEMAKEVKMEPRGYVIAEGHRIEADFHASSYESDRHALQERKNILGRRKDTNNNNRSNAARELKSLDDVAQVKLNNLMRRARDAGEAVGWLRANKDKFRMQVFEPPALSVTVPDQSYAAGVESCFGATQMTMFICQCQEDYDTLNHHINDTQGLGRHARIGVWFRSVNLNELAQPPMSQEELAKYGFDGYALSYVECEKDLEWYLMRELNLHRTAISQRGVRDLRGAIDAVAGRAPAGHANNTNFIDGQTQHQVSRSRYGQRRVNSSAMPIGPARYLKGQQVHPADKQRIDDTLKRCEQEATEIHEEEEELRKEMQRLNGMKKQYERSMDAIKKRLKVIKDNVARQGSLKAKLDAAKRQQATALEEGDAVQEGARCRAKMLKNAQERMTLVTGFVEMSRDVVTEQTRATKIGLQYLQIGAKAAVLKELCDRKDTSFQAALAEFNKMDVEYRKLKNEALLLLDDSKAVCYAMPVEIQEQYHHIQSARAAYEKSASQAEEAGDPSPEPGENVDLRSVDELQTELEKQEANLEMNMNTNLGVVEQYEKRKRDIEVLGQTIKDRQRQADKCEERIKNARDKWEPALQALVTSIGKKFSAAFDRIDCAGEIRIRQEEAYDQWAIDILVKFRDTEKLQLLTAQRQSGGERSLTTVLYLMSLIGEARAPFSVVDEINQGMDQYAERLVHNSMVEVTCKPDSAQYFLITPKLLPDLEYHERMRVLCVNNGEWLPEESGLGNMMNMIEGFVAKNPRHA